MSFSQATDFHFPESCNFLPGVDYEGSGVIELDTNTAEECQNHCHQDVQCAAFEWHANPEERTRVRRVSDNENDHDRCATFPKNTVTATAANLKKLKLTHPDFKAGASTPHCKQESKLISI